MPYIETVSEIASLRRELSKADLCFIGEFTRENISRWLDRGSWFEVGLYGYADFHAVCGDIDIPWSGVAVASIDETTRTEANDIKPAPSRP